MTYEQFVENEASPYMFENDLLEQTFKFWETDAERHERVKSIWLQLKRRNALGGLDSVSVHEHDQATRKIVRAIRDLRFKVDQKLVQNNVEPVFKENYKTYAKWEFLADSDVEFSKLRSLL